MLKNDAEDNISNWVSNIKSLLIKLGFEHVWLNQGVENKEYFLLILRQRIRDIWLLDFNNRLENSTRAIFFRTILSHNFCKYLDVINIRKYRIALARLRRWQKPICVPFNERVCPVCNILEDEYHFTLECTMFKELRLKYIKRFYWNHPSNYKFIALMTTENVTEIRNLSVFAYHAFIKHRQWQNVV